MGEDPILRLRPRLVALDDVDEGGGKVRWALGGRRGEYRSQESVKSGRGYDEGRRIVKGPTKRGTA